LKAFLYVLARDLEPAKRRRLRKAADVLRRDTPTAAEEEAVRPGEEKEEVAGPDGAETTGPVADEATWPVADDPQAEAAVVPPLAEETQEEGEKTVASPRPATPPERPENNTGALRPDSPAAITVVAAMEVDAPLPPSAGTEASGEAASSEAAADVTTGSAVAPGQASPAPEVLEETPLGGENDGASGSRGQPPSPQARIDPGPSAEASSLGRRSDVTASQPWEGSLALVLSGASRSSARRNSAFRQARGSLDGLEAHLAFEDAELARKYDELAQAWAQFHEAVELSRQSVEAARAQREEALRHAKEVREAAERDAKETLEPLQAERRAAAKDLATAKEEREAAALERKTAEENLTKRGEDLGALEKKIISDAEVVRQTLDQHRAALDSREETLAAREDDVVKREEQLLQSEQELNTQREDLEAREDNLARAESNHKDAVASHAKHVERFNKKLAEKKEEQERELAEKEKTLRAKVSAEYAGKFKKQEENFKRKRGEDGKRIRFLEEQNVTLNSQARRARSERDRAVTARQDAEQDLAKLVADMEDMNAQVGPAVERVVQAEENIAAARVLTQQRERMFRSLVSRGDDLATKLGVTAPHVPVQGNSDIATYLAYFDRLFSALEGPVAELGDVVDEECRQLLDVAIDRVFTNLQHLHPGFDYTTVTEPLEGPRAMDISNSVREEVADYCSRFKRVATAQGAEGEAGSEEASGDEAGEKDDGRDFSA